MLERLRAEWTDPDFVLAAGDDRTDEDLFERLQSDAWTVHVGPGPTRASYTSSLESWPVVIQRVMVQLVEATGAGSIDTQQPSSSLHLADPHSPKCHLSLVFENRLGPCCPKQKKRPTS